MNIAATNWEQMPYFLAVARSGSLRAAADELGTTHAKINRHLMALEGSYGMQLLRKTRRGIELTDAGKMLLPVAEEAERLFLGAQQRLTGLDRQETGWFRFSLTGSMAYEIVGPILVKFFEAYPGIDIGFQPVDIFKPITDMDIDVGAE